jgi:uncharacterized membrane protein YraQ (UPF0718 family)
LNSEFYVRLGIASTLRSAKINERYSHPIYMFKPYSIVEETPEETIYEFKTIYLWILYGIVIVGMIGLVLRITTLTTVGGVCMVIYFLTVSLQYRRLGTITKQAAMTGSVKFSGSKASFSKPLRITITKANAEQDVTPNR